MLAYCNAYYEATGLYVQACLPCRDYITGLLRLLLGCDRHNKLASNFCYAGLFSWWVMQGGPDRGVPAVVWAVEPLPANLAVLHANLELHGLLDHVSAQQCSIAEYLPLCLACSRSYTHTHLSCTHAVGACKQLSISTSRSANTLVSMRKSVTMQSSVEQASPYRSAEVSNSDRTCGLNISISISLQTGSLMFLFCLLPCLPARAQHTSRV